MAMGTGTTLPASCTSSTRAAASRAPNVLTPLKTAFPRPFHRLRKLKIALMTVGALRDATRRTFVPPMFQIGSGTLLHISWARPGTMSTNFVRSIPWEDTTSSLSKSTDEKRLAGSASRWSGKSLGTSVWFGGATSNVVAACAVPGFSWFFVRSSAPAWKWQLAQAWMPSLPTCMSQKNALPRAMAAVLSRTKRARLVGSGTATVLSEGGAGGRTCAPVCPPRSAAPNTAASSTASVLFMGTSLEVVLIQRCGKRQGK